MLSFWRRPILHIKNVLASHSHLTNRLIGQLDLRILKINDKFTFAYCAISFPDQSSFTRG